MSTDTARLAELLSKTRSSTRFSSDSRHHPRTVRASPRPRLPSGSVSIASGSMDTPPSSAPGDCRARRDKDGCDSTLKRLSRLCAGFNLRARQIGNPSLGSKPRLRRTWSCCRSVGESPDERTTGSRSAPRDRSENNAAECHSATRMLPHPRRDRSAPMLAAPPPHVARHPNRCCSQLRHGPGEILARDPSASLRARGLEDLGDLSQPCKIEFPSGRHGV